MLQRAKARARGQASRLFESSSHGRAPASLASDTDTATAPIHPLSEGESNLTVNSINQGANNVRSMIHEPVQNIACCENERAKATCSRDRAAQNNRR